MAGGLQVAVLRVEGLIEFLNFEDSFRGYVFVTSASLPCMHGFWRVWGDAGLAPRAGGSMPLVSQGFMFIGRSG